MQIEQCLQNRQKKIRFFGVICQRFLGLGQKERSLGQIPYHILIHCLVSEEYHLVNKKYTHTGEFAFFVGICDNNNVAMVLYCTALIEILFTRVQATLNLKLVLTS